MKRPVPWTAFFRAVPLPISHAEISAAAQRYSVTVEEARAAFEARLLDETWKNSRYQVVIDRSPAVGKDWPPMLHLSIKRLDRRPLHDWRDLQRIKNELIGPEHEAVELYPAERRLVDGANQYHLWVLSDAATGFPFGFTQRSVDYAPVTGKARQRPLEDAS